MCMKYEKLEKIAKGWSSFIWLAKDTTGKKVIIKEVREKSNRKNLAEREGSMLALANTVHVGPKLIESNLKANFVVMKYIKGKKLLDFVIEDIDSVNKNELYLFILELYSQCLALDKIGLAHTQLQVGKNILVTKKQGKLSPIIIDFEKGSLRTDGKAKNIGQLESFLFYNPNGLVAKKIRKKLNLKL
jgi:putative serine/threonine protein kinase